MKRITTDPLLINFLAVANLNYRNLNNLILNQIDDAIILNANSIERIPAPFIFFI